MQEDVQGLVRAAQAGNQSALGRLYALYFERVYRYMMARVGNPAEAEDLTQELFIKLLSSLGSYRFQGPPFSAWLFRIAHNLVVDWSRRRKSRGEQLPLEQAATLPAAGSVEEEAALAADRQAVEAALTQLTDLQRQVVLLRFIGELSLAETAMAMERSENAVKALQHSALQALRRLLLRQPGRVSTRE